MSEHTQRRRQFQEKFEQHLDSPATLLSRLRDSVFGTSAPQVYTRIAFWIGVSNWLVFILWSALGYVALKLEHFISDNKRVNLSGLIEKRGAELGYNPTEFVASMENLYFSYMLAAGLVAIGLVLVWRESLSFVWLYFPGMILFPLLTVAFGGWNYLSADVSLFDKLFWFVTVVQMAVYGWNLYRRVNGEDFDFFNLDSGE